MRNMKSDKRIEEIKKEKVFGEIKNTERATNHMKLTMAAESVNEGLARIAIAAFASGLNPTLDELEDVKTAVSEAVTNAIIHGYRGIAPKGEVVLEAYIKEDRMEVSVTDYGVGIEDVERALEPLYTTAPQEERSGMGFAFMEAFMDELVVTSRQGETVIKMVKKIGKEELDV